MDMAKQESQMDQIRSDHESGSSPAAEERTCVGRETNTRISPSRRETRTSHDEWVKVSQFGLKKQFPL